MLPMSKCNYSLHEGAHQNTIPNFRISLKTEPADQNRGQCHDPRRKPSSTSGVVMMRCRLPTPGRSATRFLIGLTCFLAFNAAASGDGGERQAGAEAAHTRDTDIWTWLDGFLDESTSNPTAQTQWRGTETPRELAEPKPKVSKHVNDCGDAMTHSPVTNLYYCGKFKGRDAIPGSDGRCGPNNGPQCASCRRLKGTGVDVSGAGIAAVNGFYHLRTDPLPKTPSGYVIFIDEQMPWYMHENGTHILVCYQRSYVKGCFPFQWRITDGSKILYYHQNPPRDGYAPTEGWRKMLRLSPDPQDGTVPTLVRIDH